MKRLDRWLGSPRSIRRRLILLILGANAVLAAATIWGHLWNHSMGDSVRAASRLERLASETRGLLQAPADISATLGVAVSTGADCKDDCERVLRQVEAGFAGFHRHFAALLTERPALGGGLEAQAEALTAAGQATLAAARESGAHLNQGDHDGALRLLNERYHPAERRLTKAIDALAEALDRLAETHTAGTLARFDAASRDLYLIQALALPLSLIFSLLVIGMIVRPLSQLASSMRAVVEGKGDLAQKLPEGSGEAGELAGLYNGMTHQVHSSLLRVVGVAALLDGAAKTLYRDAEQTRLGLVGQEAEVAEVTDKMATMEQDVGTIEETTRGATEAARSAYQKTESGQTVMRETMQFMQQLDREAAQTAEKMQRFIASVAEISVVLEVITKVAEQTNLLALNAAIEAARAGEQGRGFAVVADEVRSLAVRTRDSADTITRMIGELRSNAEETEEAITSNRGHAAEALTKVGEMAAELQEIDSTNRRIADMSGQIADAVARQAQAATDINRNTVNLKMTTRQAETNAHSMETLGADLTGLVRQLQEAIASFNIEQEVRIPDLVSPPPEPERRPPPQATSQSGGADGDIELF